MNRQLIGEGPDARNHDVKQRINVPGIQSLMEAMSRLTGMPVAMRDADGRLLAAAGSWGMCDAFHRKHPDADRNCAESVACLSQGIAQGDFKLLKCKNNLCAMATPILVDGHLAGNVYCGHFFQTHDQPDETLFRTQARRYGFDEKTYLDAYRRVPVFDKEISADIIACYSRVGNMIATQGGSNYRLQQMLDEQCARFATLNERERELNSLISSIPGVTYRCLHDSDWTMKYLSEEIFRLSGYPASDFIDNAVRSYNSVIFPDDRENVRLVFQNMSGSRPAADLEYRICHKDGSVRWVHERSCGFFNDGKLRQIDGILMDVTARKKAQEELVRMNRKLEKALQELRIAQSFLIDQERHHALSTMASGIAHDFNNALAVIQGYSDLLLHNQEILADGDTTKNYVEYINQAAHKAASTVRCLRKFYQPRDIGAQTQMDLNRVIEEALTMCRPRWRNQARAQGAEIKVVKQLDEIPPILGNEAELHELMTNLIFNAVDAMPAGGSLSVKTFHDDGDVYLRVSDTGIGMSDEVRNNCLNPFFTTRRTTGSGLGLSVVQGVVKRHNGEIFVDSAPNQGTTLEIRFPSTTVTVEDLAEDGDDGPREPAGRRTVKILVVEDDAAQAALLQQILKAKKYIVDTAADGVAGLTKAVEESYDLVITDQSMPGISGSEMARKIRRARPDQPIILLTGFGDIMNAASEDEDGYVDKVLSKPYAGEDLCREIREQLAKRI